MAYTGGTGANQTSFEAQAGNYWYGSGLLYNQSGTASLLNQVPTLTFTIGGDTVVFHTEGDATVVATNGDAGFELWGYSVDTTSGTYTNGNPAVCVAGLTQTTAQGKCPSFLVAMLGVDASPSGTQTGHVAATDSTVGTVGSVQTLTASNSAWRFLQTSGAVTGGGAQAGTTISSTTGFGDVGSTLHLSAAHQADAERRRVVLLQGHQLDRPGVLDHGDHQDCLGHHRPQLLRQGRGRREHDSAPEAGPSSRCRPRRWPRPTRQSAASTRTRSIGTGSQ